MLLDCGSRGGTLDVSVMLVSSGVFCERACGTWHGVVWECECVGPSIREAISCEGVVHYISERVWGGVQVYRALVEDNILLVSS